MNDQVRQRIVTAASLGSGLGLRADYADLDAVRRFKPGPAPTGGDEECLGGRVMLGTLRPDPCPAFGNRCRPEHPLGAPMVSSEGAGAAYFRFRGPPAATG
ncbi:MAG: hypothetical protein NTW21_18070 [Verrucomicrobia bacterium]|nr:hypothetical protein [Verrucomicrobiota bacterium]